MNHVPESNQRGSPNCGAPGSEGTAQRSGKRAFFAGALLTVSFVMALGALSGTAAAETSSTDAGEAVASAQQMAADLIEAAEGSTAVNPSFARSSARSAVEPVSIPVSSDRDIDVSAMTRAFTEAASSPDPVEATRAEVSAVIEELEIAGSSSFGSSSISEPEMTSSMTIESVEEEPVVMAEVTPASHEINQCNPPEFPGDTAGWEVSCDVEIVNTITPEGDESSVVTTTSCLAAAGVLPPFGCTTVVSDYDHLTTDVNQCNGVATGGGSNVTCSVTVINNVPVGTDTTPLTVNQCNGSGNESGPSGLNCDPADATTSGAMVNQCNGSATGGGSLVTCTVEGEETAVPLTIEQCNGSATGGGDTVTCDVTVTNNFIEPDGETPPNGETPPDGDGPSDEEPDGDGPGDQEPGTGGPGTGGPGTGGSGTTVPGSTSPVAVAPIAFVTPVVPAAAPSGTPLAGAGTATEAASSATGTSTLPATGSDIGSMTALALLAMVLGGLMILTSRSGSKATAKS